MNNEKKLEFLKKLENIDEIETYIFGKYLGIRIGAILDNNQNGTTDWIIKEYGDAWEKISLSELEQYNYDIQKLERESNNDLTNSLNSQDIDDLINLFKLNLLGTDCENTIMCDTQWDISKIKNQIKNLSNNSINVLNMLI